MLRLKVRRTDADWFRKDGQEGDWSTAMMTAWERGSDVKNRLKQAEERLQV